MIRVREQVGAAIRSAAGGLCGWAGNSTTTVADVVIATVANVAIDGRTADTCKARSIATHASGITRAAGDDRAAGVLRRAARAVGGVAGDRFCLTLRATAAARSALAGIAFADAQIAVLVFGAGRRA